MVHLETPPKFPETAVSPPVVFLAPPVPSYMFSLCDAPPVIWYDLYMMPGTWYLPPLCERVWHWAPPLWSSMIFDTCQPVWFVMPLCSLWYFSLVFGASVWFSMPLSDLRQPSPAVVACTYFDPVYGRSVPSHPRRGAQKRGRLFIVRGPSGLNVTRRLISSWLGIYIQFVACS